MKKKISIIIIGIISIINLSSCDKESLGNNYDFSNSLPPYVALRSKATITRAKGSDVMFTIQSRTSLQKNTIITFSVTGSVVLANQKVTLLKDRTTVDATFNIPGTTIPGTATVTLNSAITEDGRTLTLGADNVAATQKFDVIVTN